MNVWIWCGLISVTLVAVLLAAQPLARWWRRREFSKGRAEFRLKRELLEAEFLRLAGQSGKPRGLTWGHCDWLQGVRFARDRNSGLLTAFVGMEVRFEAVPGSEMEGVAAVGTIREAVAVFHYRAGRWGTGGRALFNMNLDSVIQILDAQFLPVEQQESA